MSRSSISLTALLAFAAPALAIELVNYPIQGIIPVFYAAHTAVTLAQIGTIILVLRVVDALADPLIGILSDRTHSPIGARKPWMLAGGLVAALGVYVLFSPSPTSGPAYFAIGSLLFFLGWSLIDIPLRAWSSEITRDYDERSRVTFFLTAAGLLGFLAFCLLPLLPFFSDTSYSPETMAVVGIAAAILFPVTTVLAAVRAPTGERLISKPPRLREIVAAVRSNRPLLRLFGTMIIGFISVGMAESLAYPYIADHLKLERLFPYILLANVVGALGSLPIWVRVTYRFGKPRAWAITGLLTAIVSVGLALIPPGESSFVVVLVLAFLRGAAFSAFMPMPSALLGDVIDYDILKSRVNRAGNYFAFFTLTRKTCIAIGTAVGFYVLDLVGYKFGAVNGPSQSIGMIVVAMIVPAVLGLVTAFLAVGFPITQQRHTVIKRRIESRPALKEIASHAG